MAVKNFQIQESSQEIEKLRNEINSYDVKNESLRLYTILIESKSRLSRLELIHKRLVLELEDTIEDINQLSLMTDRLLSFDNAHHQDQLQSQRNLQLEIEDLKNVFMEQVKIRECLEGDLELILEVDLQDPDAVCPAPLQYEKQETSFNAYVDTNGVTPSLKSTRLERELGFLELKVFMNNIETITSN